MPSTLALGAYEFLEDAVFLTYPVVFPKHLTVQVQTLLHLNNIQEAKIFERSAVPHLQYEVSHQWSTLCSGRLCFSKDPLSTCV